MNCNIQHKLGHCLVCKLKKSLHLLHSHKLHFVNLVWTFHNKGHIYITYCFYYVYIVLLLLCVHCTASPSMLIRYDQCIVSIQNISREVFAVQNDTLTSSWETYLRTIRPPLHRKLVFVNSVLWTRKWYHSRLKNSFPEWTLLLERVFSLLYLYV